MKFNVHQIPADGWDYEQVVTVKQLDLDPKEIGLLDDQIYFKAFVKKINDFLLLNLTAKAQFQVSCSRCLQELDQNRELKFDLEIDIPEGVDVVDIMDDLRQELLVHIDPWISFKEDQGKCVQCNTDIAQILRATKT